MVVVELNGSCVSPLVIRLLLKLLVRSTIRSASMEQMRVSKDQVSQQYVNFDMALTLAINEVNREVDRCITESPE